MIELLTFSVVRRNRTVKTSHTAPLKGVLLLNGLLIFIGYKRIEAWSSLIWTTLQKHLNLVLTLTIFDVQLKYIVSLFGSL